MLLLTLVSVLLVSILLCFAFYPAVTRQGREEIKNEALLLESFLNQMESTDPASAASSLFSGRINARLTLIAKNGIVLYDSNYDARDMENHSEREEVRRALEYGWGESKRFSSTVGEEIYYYTVRLTNGDVLRLSKTSRNVFGIFVNILPGVALFVIFVLLIGNFLAVRLTNRIVEPINRMDPEEENSAAYDELIPFQRRIRQQKAQLQEQLEVLESRSDTITAIIGSMREGLLLLDRDSIVLSANKSALAIFDEDEDADGRHLITLTRELDILEGAREALLGKTGEMAYIRGNRHYQIFFSPVAWASSSQYKPASLYWERPAPVAWAGSSKYKPSDLYLERSASAEVGAIILFLDVTEKARAEKLREEFSANVSHELKTPLTSISGYAEMIAGGMTKAEDVRVFAEKIREEAARLIELIEDVMMLSHLDESSRMQDLEEVRLKALAREAAEALALKASEYHVSVEVRGEEVSFRGNYTMLYEMFYNLIDNGIKYNKPGGTVSVIVKPGKKSGDGEAGQDRIRITISDTGIGIPQQHQERVFERFYRVDKSRSKKTGGTGLGLSIVKHAALAHGGVIAMQSKENEGTTIAITLYVREQ